MLSRFKKEDGNWWLGWIVIIVVIVVLISVFRSDSKSDASLKKEEAVTRAFKAKKPTVIRLINKAPVAAEKRDGYDRDLFRHWSDLDSDGCDTRDEVLVLESRIPTNCDSLKGSWYSPYDGATTTNPSSFDIDHMVPLAEAWDSGAYRFSSSKRELYANDMYPPSLIAVSASSNRSKSDKDPAEWLPERSSYICRYLANWVLVKYRWRLTYDRAEKKAVRKRLLKCSRSSIKASVPRQVG